MAVITYIEHGGQSTKAQVPSGQSVMEGAVANGVEGIVAACGGGMACATCHCYVDENWQEKVGGPCEDENELLEGVESRQANSRLSCQIIISDALDGLVVHLPKSQY